MYFFVLADELRHDVIDYARRHCMPGDFSVYTDRDGKLVAGFKDEDRATLFLNLFDDEIKGTFVLDRPWVDIAA